jgi:hypothetical protein
MTVSVFTITIDSASPKGLATFWLNFLKYEVGPSLLFAPTSRRKTGKNRIHLDLRPDDQLATVRLAQALGATKVSVGQPEDSSWVVMADPEGNEFCVLQSKRDFDMSHALADPAG